MSFLNLMITESSAVATIADRISAQITKAEKDRLSWDGDIKEDFLEYHGREMGEAFSFISDMEEADAPRAVIDGVEFQPEDEHASSIIIPYAVLDAMAIHTTIPASIFSDLVAKSVKEVRDNDHEWRQKQSLYRAIASGVLEQVDEPEIISALGGEDFYTILNGLDDDKKEVLVRTGMVTEHRGEYLPTLVGSAVYDLHQFVEKRISESEE